jgi:3-aminobutyryl-CoA ammonia-lyase
MDHPPHRRYVPYSDAHYAGGLVDGAYVMRLFGELITDMSIASDSDEGLLAGYESVKFLAPVYGGDVLEVAGTTVDVGRRSRRIQLTCHVTARADNGLAPSSSSVLKEKLLVTEATATLVVPEAHA